MSDKELIEATLEMLHRHEMKLLRIRLCGNADKITLQKVRKAIDSLVSASSWLEIF